MANIMQSNPVYYSLASLTSGQQQPQSSVRTVVLHKQPGQTGFGVYIGEDIPSGLYVVTVERNSPAADANIQPGDRVLAVNGQSVASIPTNPKEVLVNAAANAQSLTLTIKSTDIFQTLNLPLTNSAIDNKLQNVREYSTRHTIHQSTDLEGYIRSLFANENVQILQAGTKDEINSQSYPRNGSTGNHNSLPNRTKPKTEHSHHRHRRSHPSRKAVLVTHGTQTSIDDEQNETVQQAQSSKSSARQPSTRPNMGTNQLLSKNQNQMIDNTTPVSQQTKVSKNNEVSDFSGIPPSPISDDTPRNSKTKRTPLPASTATVFSASDSSAVNKDASKPKEANPTMTHIADVVKAAVDASRANGQSDTRTRTSNREQTNSNKQSTAPTTSRGDGTTATPTQENTSRQPAPTGRQDTSTSAIGAIVSTPNAARPTGSPSAQMKQPPPPYTERSNNNPPQDAPKSTNEDIYHVPTGEINQQPKPAARTEGPRSVHLTRASDFQGFGFHLQYNKSYYLVQSVEEGSPAAKAGLYASDVILSINHEKTDNMPHATFVQIVNQSPKIDFDVVTIAEYLRTNAPQSRNPPATSSTAPPPTTQQDDDKNKSGLSKALGKLTSR